MVQGFLLGLASGTVCLATCLPVLFPLLLGEGSDTRQNYFLLGKFLSGRLVGYMLFGLIAGVFSQLLNGTGPARELILGAVDAILSILMIVYGFSRPREVCAGKAMNWSVAKGFSRWPELLPTVLGFLTGLSLCPPFLLALAGASNSRTIIGSMLFFLAFFFGTCLYFIPMPVIGLANRFQTLKIIGRLAAIVIAVYYLYTGIILLGGGIMAL
ncbi:MAG: sulfite exporter TauE/SafE family protein [Chitinophagales bacterium]